MARVHDHDDAGKRRSRTQIRFDERLPSRAQRLRCARKAIAGQVDKARGAEIVEVDGLRPAGRLAREGEAPAPEERIDRARLADVGAPREGDLGRSRRRQIGRPAGRREELCLRE
jgi:hypothetical protein